MGKEQKGKGDGPEDKGQEVVQNGRQRTGSGRGVTLMKIGGKVGIYHDKITSSRDATSVTGNPERQ